MPSVHTITRVSRVDLPYLVFFILHYLEYLCVDGMFLLVLMDLDNQEDIDYLEYLSNVLTSIKWRDRIHWVQGTHEQIHGMNPDEALKEMMETVLDTYPLFQNATLETNDWLFSVDSDEYLYLPGTLMEFLDTIPSRVMQIKFPWFCVENTRPWLSRHPYLDILELPWTESIYVKSVVRVHDRVRYKDPHAFLLPRRNITWTCRDGDPKLFHLHSQSLATTLNKILYHHLPQKSDEEQKQILKDAVSRRDPELFFSLYKICIIRRDITEGVPHPKVMLCERFHEMLGRYIGFWDFREKEKEMLYAALDPDAVEWITTICKDIL